MKINENETIWMEKYRPQLVQDLVLPQELKDKLQTYVAKEDIPNLGLWSSAPGTGKSSVANAIIREINGEALFINASLEKGIDILRGKIQNFATAASFDDKIKIVVMDEVDNLTKDAQFAFRSMIESFSSNCRFIMTGNYKDKIIEPLLDRLENYDFNSFNKQEMVKPMFERLQFILGNENIQFDPKELVPLLNTCYPSLRKMVGTIQKFSSSGTLKIDTGALDELDVFDKVMIDVQSKNFNEMVLKVNDLNAPNNMYSYLYKNLDKYYTSDKQPQVTLTIAKYQHMSSNVRDLNLNLAACCTELMSI